MRTGHMYFNMRCTKKNGKRSNKLWYFLREFQLISDDTGDKFSAHA